MGVAAENDARDIVAVDRGADRVPEDGGREPLTLPVRHGGRGRLIEPHEFGIERSAQIAGGRGHLFGDAIEVFRVNLVDEMNFSAQKAGEFDLAIGLNVDPDRIEVRQLLPAASCFQ